MSLPPPLPKLTLVSVEEASAAARRRRPAGRAGSAVGGAPAPANAEETAPGKTDARRHGQKAPDLLLKPVTRRAFGRYQLLLEMGHGGMATLMLARLRGPEHFEKLLAVKRIHEHLGDEEEFVKMFLDEARIAARIHHPNVAALFDLGDVEGAYYLAMEYVHGQTLTDVLRRAVDQPEPFSWPLAVRVVADAAAGLHAAHALMDTDGRALGVVHRDVSPHNLLVSYDGQVKVIDFGIAYAARKLTQTGVGILKGKIGYMSPEQVDGQPLDARSDIFALGIVLYECLTRARLFNEDTETDTLLKVRRAEIAPLRSLVPDVSVGLEAIVHRALARRPADRFASAEALSEALEELLVAEGEAVSRKRLATMMDAYFHERRQVKDQQIRIALQSTGESAAIAAPSPFRTPPAVPLTRPHTRLEQLGSGLWGRAWIAGAIALLALLVAVGVLLLRPKGSPPSPPSSAASPASPAAARAMASPPALRPTLRARGTSATPAVRTRPTAVRPGAAYVTLTVKVVPARADAVVRLRRQLHRGALSRLLVARDAAPVVLKVRAPGHQTETVRVVPDQDRMVTVQLHRRPPHRRSRRPRSRLIGLD